MGRYFGVFAHEVSHIIHKHGFAENLSGGSGFDEGLATWAAGQYWNEWHGTPSLQASVRTYLEAGTYLPLYKQYDVYGVKSEATKSDEDCLDRRDTLYTEWAAFIRCCILGLFIDLSDTNIPLFIVRGIQTGQTGL